MYRNPRDVDERRRHFALFVTISISRNGDDDRVFRLLRLAVSQREKWRGEAVY